MKQLLNMNDNTRNILLMVIGLVLFLYALGLFTCTLRILVIILAIAMFITGFMRGGYMDLLTKHFRK